MDILSARKKAAERAKALKKTGEEASASVPALPEQQSREAAASAQPPAGVSAGPASGDARDVKDAAAEKTPSPESPEAAETSAPLREIEMLGFRLGDEEYAVMIDAVKEVLTFRELTPVPNAPDYVLGVMALRGLVLPVIDLCKRLGLPAGKRDERSRIIVVSVNDEDAGLHVDRVTGVVRLSPDAVRPTPETIEHGAEFLRGIARKEDRLYILLDIEKAAGA